MYTNMVSSKRVVETDDLVLHDESSTSSSEFEGERTRVAKSLSNISISNRTIDDSSGDDESNASLIIRGTPRRSLIYKVAKHMSTPSAQKPESDTSLIIRSTPRRSLIYRVAKPMYTPSVQKPKTGIGGITPKTSNLTPSKIRLGASSAIITPKANQLSSPSSIQFSTPKSKVSSSRKSRKSLTNSLNLAKSLMKNRSDTFISSPLLSTRAKKTAKKVILPPNRHFTEDETSMSIDDSEYIGSFNKLTILKPSKNSTRRTSSSPVTKSSNNTFSNSVIQPVRTQVTSRNTNNITKKKTGKKRARAQNAASYNVIQPDAPKSFEIEVHRLAKDLNGKRVKLNSLDVISTAIFEHLKRHEHKGHEKLVQRYTELLYDSVLRILDLNLVLSNLTSNLKEISTKKLKLRAEIFKMREQNSKNVNHQLELLRYKNINLKENNIQVAKLSLQLHNLRRISRSPSEFSGNPKQVDVNEIKVKLSELRELISPCSGILNRLKGLNGTLNRINEDITNN